MKYLFLLVFLLTATSSFAQVNNLLTHTDSVFIGFDGPQKYLLHKVKKGHTLYSIKRFYGVAVNDLYLNNPQLEEKGLKVNQILKIPFAAKALKRSEGRDFTDTNFVRVYYRVRPKETFYSISKTYFNIPLEVLQKRNKLKDMGLKTGQVLHIGWIPKTGIPDSLHRYTGLTGVLGAENEKLRKKYEGNQLKGWVEYVQEGKACWPKDQGLSHDNTLYVLYSKAPVGSVIRIENPMTERSLYAKVIGSVPDTPFARGSIIMLSPTVAYALGALDANVYVKVYFLQE